MMTLTESVAQPSARQRTTLTTMKQTEALGIALDGQRQSVLSSVRLHTASLIEDGKSFW
jgi:hypothetical protein